MGLPVKLRVAYGLWTALSTLRNFINASAWPGVRLRVHLMEGGSRVGIWETNPSQPTTALLSPALHNRLAKGPHAHDLGTERNNPRRDGHNPSPASARQTKIAPRVQEGVLSNGRADVSRWGEDPRPRCNARGRDAMETCQHYTQYHRETPMPIRARRG